MNAPRFGATAAPVNDGDRAVREHPGRPPMHHQGRGQPRARGTSRGTGRTNRMPRMAAYRPDGWRMQYRPCGPGAGHAPPLRAAA